MLLTRYEAKGEGGGKAVGPGNNSLEERYEVSQQGIIKGFAILKGDDDPTCFLQLQRYV